MILRANAKINLTLDIVGTKENGFHLLDSVFQSVSLYDEITIEKSNELSLCFLGADVDAKTSIAYKSALKFFEYTGIKDGADIKIKCQIPTSSGMGGGSSDAAGVLVGLNKLYDAGLLEDELIQIGSKIGADVPFCIVGGTARVKGIGEIIEPLPGIPDLDLVIIKHSDKLSTADMYSKLDAVSPPPPTTDYMVNGIISGDKNEILNNISNAFTTVNDIKFEEKLLKDLGAIRVGLSGSGPSVFGIFSDFETSALAFKTLSDLGYTVFCAKTTDCGIKFE